MYHNMALSKFLLQFSKQINFLKANLFTFTKQQQRIQEVKDIFA